MAEISASLANAIDGVVIAIPQLEAVFDDAPAATLEEAVARYPVPAERNKVLAVWMAWHACTRLREVWQEESPKPEPFSREPNVG